MLKQPVWHDFMYVYIRSKIQTNSDLDLLDLRVETSDVCICFLRRLFQFHDSHHWIRVIRQYAHDGVNLSTRHI